MVRAADNEQWQRVFQLLLERSRWDLEAGRGGAPGAQLRLHHGLPAPRRRLRAVPLDPAGDVPLREAKRVRRAALRERRRREASMPPRSGPSASRRAGATTSRGGSPSRSSGPRRARDIRAEQLIHLLGIGLAPATSSSRTRPARPAACARRPTKRAASAGCSAKTSSTQRASCVVVVDLDEVEPLRDRGRALRARRAWRRRPAWPRSVESVPALTEADQRGKTGGLDGRGARRPSVRRCRPRSPRRAPRPSPSWPRPSASPCRARRPRSSRRARVGGEHPDVVGAEAEASRGSARGGRRAAPGAPPRRAAISRHEHQRRQVGIGEVAVVVAPSLLRAGSPACRVPQHGHAARWSPASSTAHCRANSTSSARSTAENELRFFTSVLVPSRRSPAAAHADVRVDAQRALLHVARR
jgi:hypothetical protein